MALLLISLGALFLFVAIHLLSERFDVFDAQQYRSEALRVEAVIAQDKYTIEATLGDYAHWDDTVNFILGKDPKYVTANISGTSLNSLNINSVAFIKLDATPTSTITVSDDNTVVDMPSEMLEVVTPFFKLVAQNAIKKNLTSVLWLNGVPILVTAEPITDSDRKNPASGYMFMFRNFNGKYLHQVQQATSVPFTFEPAEALPRQKITLKESEGNPVKTWTVNQTLANLPIQISVNGPTRLLKERRITYRALTAIATGLVALSLAGIYIILNRRVLRRLRVFSQLAYRHRIEHDPNIRWPIQGDDELDNLSTSLNELMIEVNAKHQDLDYLADHDELTGVGNRRQLFKRLEAVQNRSRRQPSLTSSLLLLDLDSFKSINDELGHAIGDLTLKVVATRLLAQSRNYDTVARLDEDKEAVASKENKYVIRLGGDEFAVLLEDTEPSNALLYADRLLVNLNQPIELEGQSLIVRSSIGIAPVDPLLSIEVVMRNADLAMYEAKRRGKNQAVIFDSITT